MVAERMQGPSRRVRTANARTPRASVERSSAMFRSQTIAYAGRVNSPGSTLQAAWGIMGAKYDFQSRLY
eukprot:10445556-Lingulodinium_polyedra.AAC.1